MIVIGILLVIAGSALFDTTTIHVQPIDKWAIPLVLAGELLIFAGAVRFLWSLYQ